MAWLYRHPKSKFWYIGQRIHGRLVQRSTGTDDKAKAEQELADLNALVARSKSGRSLKAFYDAVTGPADASKTLRAEVADWLSRYGPGSTRTRYTMTAGRFMEAVGPDTLLEKITTDDVARFVASIEKTRVASTASLYMRDLRCLFSRPTKAGRIPFNPALDVQVKQADERPGPLIDPQQGKARRPFTVAEASVVIAKATGFWRYATLAGFYTGLRLGDVATLPVGVVDLQEGVMNLRTGKTQKIITVPLAPPFRAVLAERIAEIGPAQPADDLWPAQAAVYRKSGPTILSAEFRELLVECGLATAPDHSRKPGLTGRRKLSPLSFHSLRHSFVSLLKATGAGQAVAKSLAGHSSDDMSDAYTSLPLDVLQAAIARLPDIGGTA